MKALTLGSLLLVAAPLAFASAQKRAQASEVTRALTRRAHALQPPTVSDQALEQQIQSDMATSQADHNAAVAIKQNTAGWLQGAPLAAEQADVKASNAALDQAEQLQLQLQQQQSGTATGTSANQPGAIGHVHPWNCGPYPCT